MCRRGSLLFGFGLAIALCVLASALLWFVVEKLRANPIIAGLGLTGLGLGGTDLAVQAIYGSQATVNAPYGLPRLGPAFGAFGVLSILVAADAFCRLSGCGCVLRRTRFGLQLAACGEHPFAARSVGVNPSTMRLIALCAGGVLCALGGTELALGSLTIFAYGMTAGRGFMAFSAVIFGAGHPLASAAAALFFSIVGAIGIRAQLLFGDRVPNDLLLALPYIATVIGVWVSARLRGGGARPASSANCATIEDRNGISPSGIAISDVCILCADVERSIRFYADKLGFRLLHRAEGFADFSGAGLTLAVWEIDHISRHTGISNVRGPGAHKACIAVKLPSAEELDACYCGARRQGRAVSGAAHGLSVERLLLLFRRAG